MVCPNYFSELNLLQSFLGMPVPSNILTYDLTMEWRLKPGNGSNDFHAIKYAWDLEGD